MATAIVSARRNQNLYRQPAKIQLGPNSATFVVIALVSLLSLLYLNQITKTSVFGYRVSTLSSQRDQILTDKQDLSVEAARLQSIQATQSSAAASKMVAVTNPIYAR